MNSNTTQNLMVYGPQAFFKLISNTVQHPRLTMRSILIDNVGYKPGDVINCVGDPLDCSFWLFRPKSQIVLRDRNSDWEMLSPLVPDTWSTAVDAIRPLLWPSDIQCQHVKMWGSNIYGKILDEEFLIVSDETQTNIRDLLFLVLLKMVSHTQPDYQESPFEMDRLRSLESTLLNVRKGLKNGLA